MQTYSKLPKCQGRAPYKGERYTVNSSYAMTCAKRLYCILYCPYTVCV